VPDQLPSNFVNALLLMPKNEVPESLLEFQKEEAPDKVAIKKALDAGDEVPGASLSRGTRLVLR
ncbi:hypothetical protein LCGC14_2784580, partial [marine sediment metagenome]